MTILILQYKHTTSYTPCVLVFNAIGSTRLFAKIKEKLQMLFRVNAALIALKWSINKSLMLLYIKFQPQNLKCFLFYEVDLRQVPSSQVPCSLKSPLHIPSTWQSLYLYMSPGPHVTLHRVHGPQLLHWDSVRVIGDKGAGDGAAVGAEYWTGLEGNS